MLFVSSKDTETHRVCGMCNEIKPLDQFYKDGKDAKGNVKYRRDCKDCYKSTRYKEAKRKDKKNGRTK
jgi:hypothetical protein